jgi:hypothetical protein
VVEEAVTKEEAVTTHGKGAKRGEQAQGLSALPWGGGGDGVERRMGRQAVKREGVKTEGAKRGEETAW